VEKRWLKMPSAELALFWIILDHLYAEPHSTSNETASALRRELGEVRNALQRMKKLGLVEVLDEDRNPYVPTGRWEPTGYHITLEGRYLRNQLNDLPEPKK
jgi:predicted transcriptional regulator